MSVSLGVRDVEVGRPVLVGTTRGFEGVFVVALVGAFVAVVSAMG